MTQTSAALREMKSNGNVRMQTFRCGLKKAVRSKAIADVLRDFAVRVGVVRHAVSLVANMLILQHGASDIDSWYEWYRSIWSAVDFVVNPAGMHSNNPYISEVRKVFEEFPELLTNLRSCVPDRCPVMLRFKECEEMGTATEQHLGSFSDRVEAFVCFRAAEILGPNKDALAEAMGKRIKRFVLADPENANHTDLESDLEKLGSAADERRALKELAEGERNVLGRLVDSEDARERWFYVAKSKKQKWKFVEHLVRYSTYMSKEVRCNQLLRRQLQQNLETEASGDAVDETIHPGLRTWSHGTKPRPFSVLPIYKLQACSVYYGYTEVNQMYAHIHSEEMRAYALKNPAPSRKRRSRASEDDDDEFEEARRRYKDNAPQRFVPDKNDFAVTIFREQLPIGKSAHHRKLICFRTDGVQLCLTFAANTSPVPGVSDLVDQGYTNVPVCKDVDLANETRGIWQITQTNGGTVRSSETINLCCVDPGFHKPVQWSRVSSTGSSSTIAETASFDHIVEDSWMRQSGRADLHAWEERRRNANGAYNAALGALSETMRRSSDLAIFREYVTVCSSTFPDRVAELCHRRRSLRSWLAHRRSQSFLSRIANRIANKESPRHRASKSPAVKLLSPEEIEELKARAKACRALRRAQVKTAVFFGDGCFKHTTRHHISIPKKSILHELGTRVPTVLIDEHFTSKKCVCGALLGNKDNDKASRVRVHQDGGDCFALRCGVCDRDELATLNIALASLACIAKQPWPPHLLRKTTTD